MLLRFQGKKAVKVEVFHGEAWGEVSRVKGRQLWRVRVNGRWFKKNRGFMYWTDFSKMLMSSTKEKVDGCGLPSAKRTRIRNVA